MLSNVFSKTRLLTVLLLALCVFTVQNNVAQNSTTMVSLFEKELRLQDFAARIPEFQQVYGKNKVIPFQLKDVVLTTLSFYPELANTHIIFEYKPINVTMNARPCMDNILKTRQNRVYRVILNNNQGEHKGLPIEKLSFNIMVGWIGHEFAHLVQYEKMSNLQIITFFFSYLLSDEYFRDTERYTDYLAIKHGLAYPLYAGVEYLLNSSDVSEEYKKKIKDNYLSLAEIHYYWTQQ